MKLDFYTKRSQLDEMQEQKLCKLESRGFWLLWWGLLAAIIVQSVVGETAQPPIGEWVLFMLASLYMLVECIRNGIWDRHVKPNLCANILGSTVAGIAVFVWIYLKGRYWPGALCAALCSTLLCFAVLQFTVWPYHLRYNQLEHSEEYEDEQ